MLCKLSEPITKYLEAILKIRLYKVCVQCCTNIDWIHFLLTMIQLHKKEICGKLFAPKFYPAFIHLVAKYFQAILRLIANRVIAVCCVYCVIKLHRFVCKMLFFFVASFVKLLPLYLITHSTNGQPTDQLIIRFANLYGTIIILGILLAEDGHSTKRYSLIRLDSF